MYKCIIDIRSSIASPDDGDACKGRASQTYRAFMTTVVNLRKNKYDIYIGRAGRGHDGYFGNPFSSYKDGGREKAIALFRDYFYNRLKIDPVFAEEINKLKGKILGCFCSPKKCHGDIIVEYLNYEETKRDLGHQ